MHGEDLVLCQLVASKGVSGLERERVSPWQVRARGRWCSLMAGHVPFMAPVAERLTTASRWPGSLVTWCTRAACPVPGTSAQWPCGPSISKAEAPVFALTCPHPNLSPPAFSVCEGGTAPPASCADWEPRAALDLLSHLGSGTSRGSAVPVQPDSVTAALSSSATAFLDHCRPRPGCCHPRLPQACPPQHPGQVSQVPSAPCPSAQNARRSLLPSKSQHLQSESERFPLTSVTFFPPEAPGHPRHGPATGPLHLQPPLPGTSSLRSLHFLRPLQGWPLPREHSWPSQLTF